VTLALDHLLLGAADLPSGIAFIERLTGVPAAPGGSHPGAGTCNALLALGGRAYLEIIAPDPAQQEFGFPIDLRALAAPRLVTFALAVPDLAGVEALARAGGRLAVLRDGARVTADGRLLRWKTLRLDAGFAADGVDPFPFFIAWDSSSLHPSITSTPGCRLRSFHVEHPDPPRLQQEYTRFGIAVPVRPGSAVRLAASLDSPAGPVDLM
jgi:hypothetical protein